MPVHLYWGDDGLALEQAVEALQRLPERLARVSAAG